VANILIVEDERDLSGLLRRHLEDEGHGVAQAFDGQQALAAAHDRRPDLVILDWMLPRLDGLEVCRRLRRESVVPILMLTARAEEIDRVLGLEVGADDYLTKPFSIRELLARVRALLRRVELDRTSDARLRGEREPAALRDGALRLDLAAHTAAVECQPVELTPKEFDLLALLVQNPGRAFARDYLVEKVWGYDATGSDRTVDTHVLRLRRKLGPVGERIETVWGIGYRFARAGAETPQPAGGTVGDDGASA
jgi:DNA-binding response OmpR family regulator